jgi:hypothetical protein
MAHRWRLSRKRCLRGMSEPVAEDRTVHSMIGALLDLLVPIEMRETYWGSNQPTRIEGTARYDSFRRIDATR